MRPFCTLVLPRLDPVAVERGIRRGGVGIKPRSLHHDPSLTHGMAPYEHIHGKYDTDPSLQRLYLAPRGCAHLFEWTLLRLKLIFAICEMPIRIGGCGLSIKQMVHDGAIESAYPTHRDKTRRELSERFSMHAPRLDLVRSYLGERVALYFAFLHHLTRWCSVSAFVGIAATMALDGVTHSRVIPCVSPSFKSSS